MASSVGLRQSQPCVSSHAPYSCTLPAPCTYRHPSVLSSFLVQTFSFLSAFALDFISFVCETGFFLLPTDWTSLRAMDVPQNRDQIQVPALSSTVQSEPGMEDSEATATGNTSLCPGALPAACPTLLCHWYIDVIWSDVSMHTPKKESPET